MVEPHTLTTKKKDNAAGHKVIAPRYRNYPARSHWYSSEGSQVFG